MKKPIIKPFKNKADKEAHFWGIDQSWDLIHQLRLVHAAMFDGDNEAAFERLTAILKFMTKKENAGYEACWRKSTTKHRGQG